MRNAFLNLLLVGLTASVALGAPPAGGETDARKQAGKLMSDGNYKEAYEKFRALCLDPASTGAAHDFNCAISCLGSLNRQRDMDDLREAAVKAHGGNWQLLRAVAESYNSYSAQGFVIAGKFERGEHRGGGEVANVFDRDRVRSLQLMRQAMATIPKDASRHEVASFYESFANRFLMHRGQLLSWRLQELTDLDVLPDPELGYGYDYGQASAAPVDADGNPLYHRIPKSFEAAASDGERWRWLLVQAMETDSSRTASAMHGWATFLRGQFGVQTMAYYNWFGELADEAAETNGTGSFAVQTLEENETMARLATGVKRFVLPDEFNYIRIFKELAAAGTGYSESAMDALAEEFENRRQYPAAASWWKQNIAKYGEGHDKWKRKRLEQITGNWGRFEPQMTRPAGKPAAVEFRFRNGKEVAFTAHRIDVKRLLDDVRAYLKSNPRELDGEKMNIQDVGTRIVFQRAGTYIGEKVRSWSLDLSPLPNHVDRRVSVDTKLSKAGAYLLTAKMAGGNESKMVVWLDDTAIVRKPLDGGKTLYFVLDAVTGAPLAHADVSFFGYYQRYLDPKIPLARRYDVRVREFTRKTDANGQITLGKSDMTDEEKGEHYQWLVTAGADSGRLAYLGFDGVWFPDYYDHEYNQVKVYTITDRPVYRPNQAVKFKVWIAHAKYDREGSSSFANQNVTIAIRSPRNEDIWTQSVKTDTYGGGAGTWTVPADTPLGVYQIHCPNYGMGVTFRVEEYKKPEFEVKVEAPTDPVMLGEPVAATIQAKYYFGAPVAKGKVKYKVLRSEHDARWYPYDPWDWFYGSGYWWFGYDYVWYPGWERWGCRRPYWCWWSPPNVPPEVVAEGESALAQDGTFKVAIDTSVAKAVHANQDHRYEITAEVTDESRRVIVGQGQVLVARKPFSVYAWVDRGYYRAGDTIAAGFSARTLDGKPVAGKGQLVLYRVGYKDNAPVEKAVNEWTLDPDDQGMARQQLKASEPGQYRLSYVVTDAAKHTIEGGYVFTVAGSERDSDGFRFNAIELVPDRKTYQPDETVSLKINTDAADSTVVLFVRPANGVYLAPRVVRLKGKTTTETIAVTKKDMPNFFVEAFTVRNGVVHSETREITVPPEKRVLNVSVLPSATTYKPGETAKVKIQLTDSAGEPYSGSTVVSVYDRSVEYVSGGPNVPEIKAFFWKWRRSHVPMTESSLLRWFDNLNPDGTVMSSLGVFGDSFIEKEKDDRETPGLSGGSGEVRFKSCIGPDLTEKAAATCVVGAPVMRAAQMLSAVGDADVVAEATPNTPPKPEVQPTVRSQFADTAFWTADLQTDARGEAEVSFPMPENLTGWKIRTWAMGEGTRVGEGAAEVVTIKNLLLRLQAPRFFVEKDEVVLSANVHNYLKTGKSVRAVIELDGGCLELLDVASSNRTVTVASNDEQRVDWRVRVVREGEALVRMKALTDEESDAMEIRFPVHVHGFLKTEPYSRAIRPEGSNATVKIRVPSERRVEQSALEVRYSPTLAGAMVDALPYLVDYPHGCTEQTLNRFLPTVLTQKILREMGLDLKAIRDKRANLNAQELGDDKARAAQWRKQWQHGDHNPVFDERVVADMVKSGVERLTVMQLSDGGWGWFSDWGEHSSPHTTAYVVHGLQVARDNDAAVAAGVIERGVTWLDRYQDEQASRLRNYGSNLPWRNDRKQYADDLDAFVFMVLVDAGRENKAMREFLYRDRLKLAQYGKAMFGVALHKLGGKEQLAMLMRNIEQFLVADAENQTAYLNLENGSYWWYWYGSEYEAQAYYLKLLARTDPKSAKAAGLVKYLLNNRKHATYWNSTRDTALCVEAMADYLRASGEDKPDMTVEVLLDGELRKSARITADNLFSFDNRLLLTGKDVPSGEHTIEVRRQGKGPVYFNAYLTNFTLEDYIRKAGLEVKVDRRYFKLVPEEKRISAVGDRGQALKQKVEKYSRQPLEDLATLKSGDLLEVELVIESKNDYEYIVIEDRKPAGFEPVEVRSGYNGNPMGAYVEFRDERVCFFLRILARGTHSVSYRTRAEIPGRFSALPTRIQAMYAPELVGNADEIKLKIED
jgi:uncharacterized protein YfaS (alpha-2-macroglobulin family)